MQIGFIGLGIMGAPMAKNLLKAGHSLRVYSRSDRHYEQMKALGAICCNTPCDCAQGVEVLITMLPDSPQVDEVLFGENGAAEGLQAGAVVIDMSSVSPDFSRSAAKRLQKKGVFMLDAPVSGGEQGAINATMTIMVGGEKDVFEKYKPILLDMGKTATLIGEHGAGNVCKLANQIITGSTICCISEAFALAERQGVDCNAVFQAIRHGMAGSAMLEYKAEKIIEKDFSPKFYLKLQAKDLRNAIESLKGCDIEPLTSAAALSASQSVIDRGFGELDHSAVYKFFE